MDFLHTYRDARIRHRQGSIAHSLVCLFTDSLRDVCCTWSSYQYLVIYHGRVFVVWVVYQYLTKTTKTNYKLSCLIEKLSIQNHHGNWSLLGTSWQVAQYLDRGPCHVFYVEAFFALEYSSLNSDNEIFTTFYPYLDASNF